jgi:hypothetical protein
MKGRPSIVLAGLAVVLFAAAGGIAYASIPDAGTGKYHACMKQNGTIRIIDPAADACNPANETEITFNKEGPQGNPGTPGVSPAVQQLAAGDSHCPAGGAAITDATGSTAYVCSGQSFSGSFTSPNGQYGVSVTDSGVSITGPGQTHISLSGANLTVQSDGDLNVLAGGSGLVKASGTLDIKGATVNIN